MDQEVFPKVVRTLKTMLKSRKISYAELARNLGMSESGIKKVFQAKDCSIGKVAKICGALDVSLSDLLAESNKSEFQDTSYTQEQQEYFLSDMECFHFYWKLAFERLPLEVVEKTFHIERKKSFRFLHKLDSLKLIKLLPEDKIQLPKLRNIRTFGDGPLIKKLYQDWSLAMMKEIARPTTKDNEAFVIRYFKVRKDTYQEFIRALRDLEAEFLKRAVRELLLHSSDELMDMRWVSAMAPRSFVANL